MKVYTFWRAWPRAWPLVWLVWFWVQVCQASLENTTNSSNIIQLPTNSRNFQVQGVTLGGWLLLEPYITPSLFLAFNSTTNSTQKDIPLDEFRYCKALGYEEAHKRLQHHWNTFYTEEDFKQIKKLGLNTVRVPIGYWAFETLESDPYVSGVAEYLDKAIGWAYANDLKVWVDLHGVPGSQNGFDNSGYRNLGHPGWFNETEYVDLTYTVLNRIYQKYGGANITKKYPDTVIAIEVVNEPLSSELDIDEIQEFYDQTYEDARSIQKVNNTIVFLDAFKEAGYWNEWRNGTSTSGANSSTNGTNSTSGGTSTGGASTNYNIMIDHHHYEVFGAGALEMNISQHLNSIKGYSSGIKKELKSHPAVVGEWLAALTDCTPWLNGVGIGTRWEGTPPYDNDPIGTCDNINDFSTWSAPKKKNYRKYIEMQLDQYESKTNGWIFWCYKTEGALEWDMLKLVELELFPQPLGDRKYIVNGTDTDPELDPEDDEGGGKEDGGMILVPSTWLLGLTVGILVLGWC